MSHEQPFRRNGRLSSDTNLYPPLASGVSHDGEPGPSNGSHDMGDRTYPDLSIGGHAHVQLGDIHQHTYHVGSSTSVPNASHAANTHNLSYTEAEKRLVESLLYSRMHARQQNVSHAMPQTCDWFFEHASYLSWINQDNMPQHSGFFWIKGKPGSGKSTLMKSALDKTKYAGTSCLILSYFFNARATNALEKSTLGMYRSILHQLLRSRQQIRENFVEKFFWKLDDKSDLEWSIPELQEYLIEVVTAPLSLDLCVFIDALDEGQQRDVREMVAFLEDFSQHPIHSKSGNSVRICLSSRHYPHITIRRGLTLVLEEQTGHKDDIQKYISSKLAIEENDTAEILQSIILQKSSQIFLWVVLVVPILNEMHDNGCTAEALLEHLVTLPDELHGLFKNVLFRDMATVKQTVLLFQWVLYAKRPLKPEELYAGIHMGANMPIREKDLPRHSLIKRYLLQCSKGLIEVLQSTDSWDELHGTVQFIHESVRDFLLKKQELAELDEDLSTSVDAISNEVLKDCCLAQIKQFTMQCLTETSEQDVHVEKIQRYSSWWKYPLLEYASQHMFMHVATAKYLGQNQDDFILLFIRNEYSLLDKWIFLQEVQLQHHDNIIRFRGEINLLYVLILQKVDKSDIMAYNALLATVLDMTLNIDAIGGVYGSMLQAACATGNPHIVELLILKNANLNWEGGCHHNALIAAMLQSNDQVVDLVSTCAAIAPQPILQETLFTVIRMGNPRRVEMLLAIGASPSLPAGETESGRTPLDVAIRSGVVETVEVILRNNVQLPDIVTISNGLIRVAHTGDMAMARLLIRYQANVNYCRADSINALGEGSLWGHLDLVRLLLEHGANPNISQGFSSQPLICAIRGNYRDIVEVLIEHGAKIAPVREVMGGRSSPLGVALGQSNLELFELLLEKGAPINIARWPEGTLLQEAVVLRNVPAVKLLLKYGVMLNERSGIYGRTALQVALNQNQLEIAEVLITNGGEIDSDYRAAHGLLEAARRGGYKNVARFLNDWSEALRTGHEHLVSRPISQPSSEGSVSHFRPMEHISWRPRLGSWMAPPSAPAAPTTQASLDESPVLLVQGPQPVVDITPTASIQDLQSTAHDSLTPPASNPQSTFNLSSTPPASRSSTKGMKHFMRRTKKSLFS